MLFDLLVPFLTIGLAELGDKTQLALVSLSAKTNKNLQLFLGAMLAFIIADGFAVFFGEFLTTLMPIHYIKIGAGTLFIFFGAVTLMAYKKEKVKARIKTPFISGFSLILVSEMGDKTQIASGLFSTRFNHLLVFAAIMAALAIVALLSIYLGKIMMKKLNDRTISLISGIAFIVIGLANFI